MSDNLSLYPNPNTGSFILSGTVNTVSNEDVYFEVSDILGHIIYTGKAIPQNGMIQEQIRLDDVAAGSYLMRVATGSGNEVFHFVISK